MQHDSLYPGDWIRVAEKDLHRVQLLLSVNDPELAGFCLQQAVEKFLKGFLLSRGWRLRRIHNLDALLDDAILYDPSFAEYRMISIRITPFYFLERYPSLELKISEKEVRDALEQVMMLIEKIRHNFD